MLITEGRPLDAAGRPRSPATLPGYLARRPPRSKGLRCPQGIDSTEVIRAVRSRRAPTMPASAGLLL